MSKRSRWDPHGFSQHKRHMGKHMSLCLFLQYNIQITKHLMPSPEQNHDQVWARGSDSMPHVRNLNYLGGRDRS